MVEELDQEVEEDHQQGEAVVDEVGRAGQLRLGLNLNHNDGNLEGEQQPQQHCPGNDGGTSPSQTFPLPASKSNRSGQQVGEEDEGRHHHQDSPGETGGHLGVVSLPERGEVEEGARPTTEITHHRGMSRVRQLTRLKTRLTRKHPPTMTLDCRRKLVFLLPNMVILTFIWV